jgi:hypothetical protein
MLVHPLVSRFACCNESQQRPKIVAVSKVGKESRLRAGTKAVERALHDVLFVRRSTRRILQFFSGKSD